MSDPYGAFCNDLLQLDALGSGTLNGLTFAVKDVFDIKGYVAGAGSPDWKRTHVAAERDADAIGLLLRQGAKMIGVTHSDELMFGLNGENYHYGTPLNPMAERHIPGGSSSGSAVAVAAGLVDFALGTDTAGSIRIPASYCGQYGFRPSHGSVSERGVVPLAPMFDTVGWIAKQPSVLMEVGMVLLKSEPPADSGFRKLFVAEDMMALADGTCLAALSPAIGQIKSFVNGTETFTVAEEGLEEWMRVFRTLQGWEIWQTHRAWIQREQPRFGPGTEERFQWSSTLQDIEVQEELRIREQIKERMRELLKDDGVILAPTAPGTPPLRNTRGQLMEERRQRTLLLGCVAGLAGLPQVNLPFVGKDGLPIGLSLIAGPGQDARLLKWVETITTQLDLDYKREE
ncbi:amidase [Paenibacillus agricola]|uniref:Amidase n=1 Tax=Paenibacillus agricola TaxID=2716264 RepID=A0ABX0J1A1_9BACL|nr:amidase [Paenibacillus agricola]NHN28894.1 amidase [Paenibacillus agricola]